MAVLDAVPLDRITTEAREVDFRRTVLTVLAGVLFAIGWVAAKTFTVLWLALAWSGTAVKVGWQQGRAQSRESRGPQRT